MENTEPNTQQTQSPPSTEDSSTINSQPISSATTKEECFENIDLVFVLDVSTSMEPFLRALEEEIGVVWKVAAERDDTPRLGLVVFVDDALITAKESYGSAEAIKQEFHRWYMATSTNRQTLSSTLNTDFPENSLDALVLASEQFRWRDADNTLRLIIHATDDTFKEAPDSFSSGLPVKNTYAQTLLALTEKKIRVNSFATPYGGEFEQEPIQEGFFSGYKGQPAIPAATFGKTFYIDEILSGQRSLADAINGVIIKEFCRKNPQIEQTH